MIGSVVTAALGAALGLPEAVHRRVRIDRDLSVRARDGVILRTDHYSPGHDGPAVLIRTPYGRSTGVALIGRLLAERGVHAVVQSCRGTFGSGGRFEPLVHERDDGLETLAWLRRQRWYDGRLGMFGVSYQGAAHWAIAPDAAPDLAAVVAAVTTSAMRDLTYAGEAFSLDTVLTWTELLSAQTAPWLPRLVELRRGQPRLTAGFAHLPLAEADRVATGGTVPFFQEWLAEHAAGAEYWRDRVFDRRLAEVDAPVLMVAGWHDIFLPAQLDDFAVLREAGHRPSLLVGPWTHGSVALFTATIRTGVSFLLEHLTGAGGRDGGTVGVTLTGRPERRDAWPPPHRPTAWYLRPDRGLGTAPAPASPPDAFTYDPRDPTPSLGGPVLVAHRSGPVDNAPLEARADVLTYTSAPLERDLTAIGPVRAEIWERSSRPYHDVFVRVCDVDRAGVSRNVCDGLVRVTPDRFPADADGVHRVTVPLWPIGHVFRVGHRLRVQVSGGAHPRWARNPGTGDPLGAAVTLRSAAREIFHDGVRRSAVYLPVEL
ncbi:CocE/NonD family hydrolase [Catenuloplanes atrovinosus]|uniref:CocE/NonD family hydrolase n=1 Tax=Catenuloplanes atrovinosus TaxID=137266 RepID=A0AAE3YTE3_9ACTN|nr:CocE/NonD family hydrolase [Catenuloplanes atrovinosus]MDR7278058.1 putative CocE/NonD family hydrolase [Catenuloplanes atrovinosus]